jgi:hypothetical protein
MGFSHQKRATLCGSFIIVRHQQMKLWRCDSVSWYLCNNNNGPNTYKKSLKPICFNRFKAFCFKSVTDISEVFTRFLC